LWTVGLTYLALALLYNALTPIGEAPDEGGHWDYLRIIVTEHRLPSSHDQAWQGHQAPTYYLAAAATSMVAAAVSGCPVGTQRILGQLNRDFQRSPNFNQLVHPATERFTAWGCAEWSFHLIRLLSTVFTLPMILLTFALLRECAPTAPAMVAVGGLLAALLPSHVSLSAMVNNDALINLLIVATTYLAVTACRTGAPKDLAVAAVFASVAVSVKLSGIYLLGLILGTLVLCPVLRARLLQRDRRVAVLTMVAACGILPAAVFLRNLREWGDLLAVGALERNLELLRAAGAMPPGHTMVRYFLVELPSLFANSFAVAFGPVNFFFGGHFEVAAWGSRVIAAGLLLSLFLREPWRHIRPRPLVLLAMGFLLFFTTYFYPGSRYRWLQARYFFNQLPLIALLSAVGIMTLWRCLGTLGLRVRDGWLIAVVYVSLVVLNVLVLTEGVWRHLYRYIARG
jgi:hypothetical protein